MGAQVRQRAMQIRNPECLVLPKDLLLLVGLLSRSALEGLYSRGTSSSGGHALARQLLSYFSCLRVARPVARGAPRAPRGSPPPPERSARVRLGRSPGPSFLLRRAPPTVRRATLRRRTPGRRSIARRPRGAS